MCDETDLEEFAAKGLSRRDFAATGALAGLAACTSMDGRSAAMTETMVAISAPDGTIDAFFVHPAKPAPAVILWPDIAGLREAKKAMARRLAASGYAVLVPNPYYRDLPAPQFADFADFAGAEGVRESRAVARQGDRPAGDQPRRQGDRRLARRPARGQHPARDRQPGLLHGRRLHDLQRRGGARAGQGGGELPRRRARHRQADQPAPDAAEGHRLPDRDRPERRRQAARGQDHPAPRRRRGRARRRRSRSIPPTTAGRCPTARSTTRSRPSARGRGCWRSTPSFRSPRCRSRPASPGCSAAR